MDISSDIKKSFETLIQNSSFLENIIDYTRTAFEVIYNLDQTT
jgi:hypothetical protein